MMSTAEKYRDKYISILGDSISTLEGYNKSPFAEFYNGGHKLLYNVHGISDTWWGMLIEHLDVSFSFFVCFFFFLSLFFVL